MPFSNLADISLEERQKLTSAFDQVCVRLALRADDPRRSMVATRIVELASAGERDPNALVEAALKTPLG